MHILNKYFNKIYVITVCPPNERVSHIYSYFKSINLNFELRVSSHTNFLKNFIYGNASVNENEQSLTSNYASIIYESYYNNLENFVILEDDNFFNNNFENDFEYFYKNLPTDWDVLHLSDYNIEEYINKQHINEFCDRIFLKYTTNCMIFKNSDKYKLIADSCVNSRYPIDYVLNSLYANKILTAYAPKKNLTHQLSYRSENERQLSNKKFNSLIKFTQ
jgi:GR25 family glycosyltransferase involved in LPS biosynthesis